MLQHKPALCLLCAMTAMSVATMRADDFDTARSARLTILAGPSTFDTNDPAIASQLSDINSTADGYWQSMESGSGRTELWTDLNFPSAADSDSELIYSAHMTSSYTRLRAMALAYKTYGGTYYGNTSLRDAVIDGLDWLRANIYQPSSAAKKGNWWDYEIGSPLKLNDTLVLIYDQLTATQISNYLAPVVYFKPSPNGGGANLIWTSHVVALSGVLAKDSSRVSNGVSPAPTALNNVTSGEGFYADNSFIQHDTFAYTGGYGIGLLSDFADLIAEFKNTQWAYSSTVVDRESYLLLNAMKPFVYKGEMQDSVRGREIARYYSQPHVPGRSVVALFLRHAAAASTSDSLALKQAAKYWIQKDTTYASQSDGFPIHVIPKAESLMSDSSVTPMTEPTGMYTFPKMDRAVFLRPGWGANLALYSTRVKNFEIANEENLHGWHTGDGLLTIYDDDLNQHSENYWPTVNPYRLDGVTALAGTSTSSIKFSNASFVGELKSFGSAYGVAAMQVAPGAALPSGKTLAGKKAWFFLDNEVVCLGTDIASTGSANVETTLVNRKLTSTGNNLVTTNNGTSSKDPVDEPATPYASSGVSYLHIAGNTSNSGIGFYFPTPVATNALRERRGRAWTSINQNPNTATYTDTFYNNYYTAYLDHGVAPGGASYAYAVLPSITASALASYAASPGFTVLANSSSVQAVYDSSAGATGAVFWSANATVGSGSNSIQSSAPSLVHVIRSGGKTSLTVTDPTQANTSSFTVTLGSSATSVVTTSSQITVNSLSPISITIDPNGLNGKAAYAQFQ